jgi:hypothetical protein
MSLSSHFGQPTSGPHAPWSQAPGRRCRTRAAPGGEEQLRVRGDSTSLTDPVTCLNYKDALAVSGKAPITRGAVRTAGIDLSGVVESSACAF